MDLAAIQQLAHDLLRQHGLTGWSFAFNNAKRQLGVCKYRPKRIELSRFYAMHNSAESIRDTLLHEIAHALAGHAAGHGPAWQRIAAQIGAKPDRCDHSTDTVTHPGDWQATCPGCQHTFHRHKRPVRPDAYRCRCPAKSVLMFRYQGDPATEPPAPVVSTSWEAQCPSCGIVHRRSRRPKPGVWRCRCPQQSKITWVYRQSTLPVQ